MKRLPLVLCVIVSALSLIVLIPFGIVQWLLGGTNVVDNWIKAVDGICFPKESD